MPRPPRIAILGIALESHRKGAIVDLDSFEDLALCRGCEVLASGYLKPWFDNRNGTGFVARMSQLRAWKAVPILVADADAGGPCEHAVYLGLKNELMSRLKRALPVDGG